MNTIWKFSFKIEEDVQLEMPIGARVLSVQTQNGQPCLWAIVDDQAKKEKRKFFVHGTGHKLPDVLSDHFHHLGTFQIEVIQVSEKSTHMERGALVFHLFEWVEPLVARDGPA
jgi:hypothetical protein